MRTPVDERGRDPWTAYHELLAQLIEIVSIPAAEMRLQKPIKIPRPQRDQPADTDEEHVVTPVVSQDAPNPYRAAIAGLAASQPRLRSVPRNDDNEQEQTA